jgi:galactan endo-1,6-beta-galactosidase
MPTTPKLFVLHQGISGQGQLFCNVLDWDSGSWQGDAQTPNTGMSAGPSAVFHGGKLYCFHQGYHQDGTLWYDVYDGVRWLGDKQVTVSAMSEGPSAVEFKGALYCFYQGSGEHGELRYTVFDGANWRPEQTVPNTGMSKSPSAVVSGGRLYCFHQGYHQDGTLWYNASDDGVHWFGDTQVTGERGAGPRMSQGPAAIEFRGALYCFYQADGEHGILRYTVFDATGRPTEYPVPNTRRMSKSPSAVVYFDKVYCFHQGSGENGELWYEVFDGSNWLVDRHVTDTGMSESPGALVAPLDPPPALFVSPNPAEVRVSSFDGWGCSLCWWANSFGKEGSLSEELADIFFSTKTVTSTIPENPLPPLPGLGMKIIRYNIGGGGGGARIDKNTVELVSPNNPVGSSRYLQGFWRNWGDGDDAWDWTADGNQRNMMALACKRGANIVEFFSNSPPWWMCYNHSSSGGTLSINPVSLHINNLQSWNYDQFARYLATVVKYARENWGINVNYLEPFNESSSTPWLYYGPKSLGDIVNKSAWVNSSQEGCNFDPSIQITVLNKLYDELNKAGLLGTVAMTAPDENIVDETLAVWGIYLSSGMGKLAKVNTHGYQFLNPYRGPSRPLLRAAVRPAGLKLWMSEYGDSDSTGITMATSMLLDLTELQPDAWVYWQPLDGGGWGLIDPDFDKKRLNFVNSKYYVFAQFSRHLGQGCRIIGNSDPNSVVAFDSQGKLIIVTLNLGRGRWISYDLSIFSEVGGPVERWETPARDGTAYQHSSDTALIDKTFRHYFQPNSVCTFEISNVSMLRDWQAWFPIHREASFDHKCQRVTALSRNPNHVDLFALGFDNKVYATFWDTSGGWSASGWLPIHPERVFDHQTQQLTALARTPDHVDLFAIGFDEKVYTTFWDTSGGWSSSGWLSIHPEASFDHKSQRVTALSRNPNHADLFAIGFDDQVYTTFWDTSGGWSPVGWRPIPFGAAAAVDPVTHQIRPPASFDHTTQEVTALARTPDHVDLFAIGSDNRVYTTFWDTSGGWSPSGWFAIHPEASFDHKSQRVTALSRNPNHVDLFAIGFDDKVYTTFWDASGGWSPSGWFAIHPEASFDHESQRVTALSRNPNYVDLFVIGFNDHVYTTFWGASGGWSPSGWFAIHPEALFDHKSQRVTALSRNPNHVDLFAIGFDNAVYTTWRD